MIVMPSVDAHDVSFRGRGAARPLVLSVVLLVMIFVLIYVLIVLPSPLIFKPINQYPPSKGSGWTIQEQMEANPYRHLDNVFHRFQIPPFNVPYLYQIQLKIYLPWRPSISFGMRNFTLEGISRMYFTVERVNRRVLVHSIGQDISNIKVLDEQGREVSVVEVSRSHPQILEVKTAEDLLIHKIYVLCIEFTGRIDNSRMSGIFSTPYIHENEKRWKTTTHLQTQEARGLFPCIDTPEAKAYFETTITHPAGTQALFNTIETSVNYNGEWTTTSFERTSLMSTYLFALAVSSMPYKETHTRNGVRVRPNTIREYSSAQRRDHVRIFAETEMVDHTAAALETVPRLLEYFETYFQLPYPLKKLDIYGVPTMKVAAMENWGLITVLQKVLIYNKNISTVTDWRVTATVLAHEIAHQWFGNLVTMRWWNNLWLNEGFASMVGLKAADYVDNVTVGMGEMSIMAARALRADQSPGSSPISRHIEESFNPDSAFNQITYRKAALIIAMVERIVGDDVFREGLRHLLNKFSYRNADHEDLMAVLTLVHDTCSGTHLTGQNFTLSGVIETWIYQNGFPILDVGKVNGQVKVSQKAYRHTGGRSRMADDLQWKIPLFTRDPKSLKPSVHWLLENSTATLDLGEDIVLDRNGQSFLRIRYDELMYADIIRRLHIDMNSIPISARTRLMDDCFTLAETGNLSYAYTFNISAYLRHETAYPPINMLNAHLDFLVSRLNVHPNFDQFQKFIITLLVPHFERFINNPVSNEDIEMYQDKLAETVFTRVCINGFPACLSHAQNLLSILRISCRDILLSNNTCNVIPTYVRQPLYATAVMYGKGEEFEFFHEKWEKEIYDGEREKIWVGMAASRKKEHIHMIFSDILFKYRHKEDLRKLCAEYSKYSHAENHFISFMSENIDRIMLSFKNDVEVLHYLLSTLARSLSRPEEMSMFSLLAERMKDSIPSGILSTLAGRLRSVVEWRNKMGYDVIRNATVVMEYMTVNP